MNCLISRDPEGHILQVAAPDGQPSALYEHIRETLADDYVPDAYVRSALDKALIAGTEKPEVAVAIWSKIYTTPFKAWYGDWQQPSFTGALDAHGEPVVQVTADGDFFTSGKTFYNLDEAPGDLVYELPPAPQRPFNELPVPQQPVTPQRYHRLVEELRLQDPAKVYDAHELEDGRILVDRLLDKSRIRGTDRAKVQDMIDRMQALFAQLQVNFITPAQLDAMNIGSRVPVDKIRSFVRGGTIYLVEGRVTPDIVVEEFLHPFVGVLAQQRPEVFEGLLQQSWERYPDIARQVDSIYTDAGGFSAADRQNEIVTRTLQRGLSQKLTERPTLQQGKLARWIEQFLRFLEDVFRKLTGKNKLYVGSIPSSVTIDDLISLLDSGIAFSLGPLSADVYYNLQPDQLTVYNRVLEDANDTQREIVEKLARNNIIFLPEPHAYVHSETGEAFNSVTKLIKGTLDQNDAYAINRAIGKEFDFIMNAIVLDISLQEIKQQLQILQPEIIDSFYKYFQVFLSGMRSNGSIVLPQLVQGDEAAMVAGTLDLLIIDPDGNMDIIDLKISKNSILGRGYDTPYRINNKDSLFYGESFSTRQQHGIQQHAYKKLIELQQEQVRSVKTLHFIVTIAKNTVLSVVPEGMVDHTMANYQAVIDKLIPTQLPASPAVTTLLQAQALPENAPVVARIQDIVLDFQKTLRNRFDYFSQINTTTTGKTVASKEYMAELSELIQEIDDSLDKGVPASAFYRIIKFINHDLSRKTEQVTKANITKEKLVDFLLETQKDLDNYTELLKVPRLLLENPTLTRMAKEALNFADSLRTVIDVELQAFIREFVQTNSSRTFTDQQLDELLQETRDISQADYLLGDMATSTDTLLATLDKVYKAKLQQVYDATDDLATRLTDLGNKLIRMQGGKPDYSFMLQQDNQGQPTPYYIRKIGAAYWQRLKSLRKKVQDDNGQALKYREVYNIDLASNEDLDFNLQLMNDKNALRAFLQAEKIDRKGKLQDGTYHRYTEEFKKVREQYEELYIHLVDGEVAYSEWRKRKNISDAAYKKYQAQYYSEEVIYLSPARDKTGPNSYDFMGRVVERSGRFVRSEFIEPLEISGNGESMLDPKYEQLMNPTNELGRLQKEFYTTWTELYEQQLSKLPTDVRKKMSGRLPMVQDRFTNAVKTKTPGIVKGFVKGLRNINPFNMKVYSQNLLVNEDGEIENQVPIYYVGDFQQAKTIEKLQSKIKELGSDLRAKKITYEEYKARLQQTRLALSIEKGKITRDELSLDMVSSLTEFAKMAENYRVMSAFESTVEAIQQIAARRTYTRADDTGPVMSRTLKEPVKFSGDSSLVLKRLEKWKEMVFYRTSNPYRSAMGQVVKKIMQYMSLKNVGLNPFGQLNNYLMGKINNAIENAGGVYWDRPAFTRAVQHYNTVYLPGLLAKRTAKLISKGDYYTISEPFSKYEALASLFRMMRKLASADVGGGLHDRALDMAYVMQESAEFNIQTKTGMAILMTRTLKHKTTGEEVSIYDAFDFDQQQHKLKIKDGFELSDATRHETINYIYEVNKQIHGNYAYEDRMVIQQMLLGELAAQFHKWIYPAFKSRYKKSYFDENLGLIEGRYYTVWNLMKYAWDMRSLSEGWQSLDERQRKNLYKSAADLVFLLLSVGLYHMFVRIGAGVDDDDETTQKFVNWMASQSDRINDEIITGVFILGTNQQYQILKSPIALLSTAKDGLEVISEALRAPVPPYDDLYYQSGVHSGKLKLTKELADIIPVLNLVNRWDSYETVKEFYIR